MRRTAGVLLWMFSLTSAADGMYTRNLACENQSSVRAKEVCRALEPALEWTWLGHAIVSPSYRMKTERVVNVYCSLPITADDIPALVDMAIVSQFTDGMRQAQINNGVLSLLSLLGQKTIDHFPALDKISDKRKRAAAGYLKQQIELTIAESSPSIFSPSHRQYILRDGCP